MAEHTRSPFVESGPSIISSSSWPAKRARGARRRRHVPTRRCWADLTYGLAGVIAELALANDVMDYMSFRAVCRGWRRGTVDARGCLDRRFHPRRWIMLPEAVPPSPAGRHRRRFLNVSTGQRVQTELPGLELDGHHQFGVTKEGLLALLDESTYAVRLLNPLTRQVAELPLLPVEIRRTITEHVVGIGLADDSTVALCLRRQLLVARPGDDDWTAVEDGTRFHSAMSFSGRFYCATSRAVVALDAGAANNEPPRLEVVAGLTFSVSMYMASVDTVKLLESDGELLLQLLRCWITPSGLERRRSYWVRTGWISARARLRPSAAWTAASGTGGSLRREPSRTISMTEG